MRQSRQYRSPYAAMLWSLVLPGFGQMYNKDYIVGFVLMVWEILVNVKSHLNITLLNTFNGDLRAAHQIIDYQWGLFYPSIYCFALWQAFNSAVVNNNRLAGVEGEKRTYFSGFFLGMVVGMDFGLFWHNAHIFNHFAAAKVWDYPVFNGIILGLFLGLLGHQLENKVYRKYKRKITPNT
ncbi:hypothetical protein AA0X95_04155 [Bacillus sp. 1P10SD]|uniref:hypothetical protein n=1 Tax=Bacillus sp. 1P10SD TaxID=3132265 RepID=UPI0039A4F762